MQSCAQPQVGPAAFTGAPGEVTLITLDPGHFHAALVQKSMYHQVSPTVYVFAPEGPDVVDHLARIDGFNRRTENPTHWTQNTYTGDDYLQQLIRERPGNVVVISGNNRKKTEYIKACVEAGLNVLSDKPMCIDRAGYKLLERAFEAAADNGVILYDIMTERSEITTLLQRELANNPDLFGRLVTGSLEEPAIVKESVHHFFKYVAGNPIKRPPWYFDTAQQGEGIVDVTTHLVDLVMWGAFPEQPIDYDRDIHLERARRWPTMITLPQFEKVTRLSDFPHYLKGKLDTDGQLPCYANGQMDFTVNGVHARVSVRWDFQAPEGTGDTHFSVMRGTNANVIIRQGREQGFRPELYVEPAPGNAMAGLAAALERAVDALQTRYPGIALGPTDRGWRVHIPDEYRIGHEAHFRQVTERYLHYLVEGELPDWEIPNMKTKYRLTTSALEMAAP